MGLPQKLLVATDFSPGADVAAEAALGWAERFGTELHFAHGVECLPADSKPSALPLLTTYVERAHQLGEQKLDEWVARAKERGLAASRQTVDGSAAQGVTTLAGELGADCLVLGSRGHTGLAHVLLGSVAERMVRDATCSVLVVRGERGPLDPAPIVLGDDLSALSSEARANALELARSLKARLDVVHGVDLGIPYLSTLELLLPDSLFEDIYAEFREDLEKSAAKTPEVEVENVVVADRPALAICQHAEDASAGLVVVGTRSRRGVERALLGSVAEQVVRHAPCSVLVAR